MCKQHIDCAFVVLKSSYFYVAAILIGVSCLPVKSSCELIAHSSLLFSIRLTSA